MMTSSSGIGILEILPDEIDGFWERHIRYLTEDGIISDREDIEYFSGEEYRGVIRKNLARPLDRHHLVWFLRDGEKIGAASFCIYHSADRECFILDFWVFPPYRGCGTGHRCYEALERYALKDGADHFLLNREKPDSVRFWKSNGYVENGRDEYDMPLYIKRIR